MSRWNPSDHPRDSRGRWRKAGLKVSARVGTRSATVTVGKTFPVIPGKIGLHLGVLARLENTSQKQGYLSKLSDKALKKIALALPEKHRDTVTRIIKKRQASVGGVQIGQIGGQRRASSIRVTNNLAKGRRQTSGVRAPNRKPRAPRVNGRRLQK